jgi:hypothetical protein
MKRGPTSGRVVVISCEEQTYFGLISCLLAGDILVNQNKHRVRWSECGSKPLNRSYEAGHLHIKASWQEG